MTILKLSVRELVEFICRSGHIISTFTNSARAIEGTRLHQLIQKRQDATYRSEVTLNTEYTFQNGVLLQIFGRADGIITTSDGIIIDEIKSTAIDLDTIEAKNVHFAQAKLYAYIYASQNQVPSMQVRLTYIHIESQEMRYFYETYTFSELETFFLEVMQAYERFVVVIQADTKLRDRSLKDLRFPYETYRPGQQEMARACFHAIKNKQVLFIQAATGIGKTLSTLYPSLKALANHHTSKIMYLTAKTITRQVALDSIDLLCEKGAYLRYVTITAKEKICFLDEAKCNPETCPYANGHYDRINEALYDALFHEKHWTRSVIETYARKHQVCPFEFSLDLYNFADVSISDYNYAFDPKVNLKRAFEEKNDYTLLVDEAHNLVDRAREMYSATLSLASLKLAKKKFKPKKGKLYRSFKKLYDYVEKISQLETPYISSEIPDGYLEIIDHFVVTAREHLPELAEGEMKEALLEVFFSANDVLRISDYYNKDYITYYEQDHLKLYCLNPHHCLLPVYKNVQSVILFSATLLPIRYFFELLGGLPEHKKYYYPSPFPPENKCLLVANDISATYQNRQYSYQDIVKYLEILLATKPGHYLVFFPSYVYLTAVSELAKKNIPDTTVFIQTRDMSEAKREEYLAAFQKNPDERMLFFCVLGGLFSEGIDLKGNQLVGVVIVSVGLPQICLERELIKKHFDEETEGFDYAYVYPGFNKVLQAAGRLLRQMDDTGVILLLDKRYQMSKYLHLFPQEWHDAKPTNLAVFRQQLTNFYGISVEK